LLLQEVFEKAFFSTIEGGFYVLEGRVAGILGSGYLTIDLYRSYSLCNFRGGTIVLLLLSIFLTCKLKNPRLGAGVL